ncbi:MAG: ribonuclease HII [Candidatus Omnitrophota bacterium]
MADFAIERRFKKRGFDIIIGVDEVGCGPLAGPVVSSAIYLKSVFFKNRIDDSKKLTVKQRDKASLEIIQKSIFALSIIDEKVIDSTNILIARRLSMQGAITSLLKKLSDKFRFPCLGENIQAKKERVGKICILVDGNIRLGISDCHVFNIIRGDALSKTIAAASILAKVNRDRLMSLYDKIWPQYGFLKHKGYPTSFHRNALKQFGPCPIHRLSFSWF